MRYVGLKSADIDWYLRDVNTYDLEDKTDELKNKLSSAHYERIQKNLCKMENSPFYTTLVSELERVADHLVNVGYYIVNPTGDDIFKKKL